MRCLWKEPLVPFGRAGETPAREGWCDREREWPGYMARAGADKVQRGLCPTLTGDGGSPLAREI